MLTDHVVISNNNDFNLKYSNEIGFLGVGAFFLTHVCNKYFKVLNLINSKFIEKLTEE